MGKQTLTAQSRRSSESLSVQKKKKKKQKPHSLSLPDSDTTAQLTATAQEDFRVPQFATPVSLLALFPPLRCSFN
jgi:hypothetical protein